MQTKQLQPTPSRRRSRFLRFSLRTLLCFALFAGSVGLTIKNSAPWVLELQFPNAILSPHYTRAFVRNIDVSIWDLEHSRKISSLPIQIKADVQPVFSDDWTLMAVLSESDVWYIFDTEHCGQISEQKQMEGLESHAFSPDGERVIGTNYYFQYALFDARTGKQLFVFDFPESIKSVEYLPKGELLVIGTRGRFAVADPKTGKPTLMSGKDEKIPWMPSSAEVDSANPQLSFGDGRQLKYDKGDIVIGDENSRTILCPRSLWHYHPRDNPGYLPHCAVIDQGRRVVVGFEKPLRVFRNVRPERWWGVVYLPECWAALALCIAFVGSLAYDWRKAARRPGRGGGIG